MAFQYLHSCSVCSTFILQALISFDSSKSSKTLVCSLMYAYFIICIHPGIPRENSLFIKRKVFAFILLKFKKAFRRMWIVSQKTCLNNLFFLIKWVICAPDAKQIDRVAEWANRFFRRSQRKSNWFDFGIKIIIALRMHFS